MESKKKNELKADVGVLNSDAIEMKMLAEKLMTGALSNLRVYEDPHKGAVIWVERDASGIVKELSAKSVSRLVREHTLTTVPAYRQTSLFQTFEALLFKSGKTIDLAKIKPVRFRSEPGDCWARILVDPGEVDLSAPHMSPFKNFLERCGDGENSLVCFLGSLLDEESARFQYLHLSGAGGDYKTAIMEAIAAAMSPASTKASSDSMHGAHFGTHFLGKRLILFPDENSATFMQSGIFKKLTGDGTLLVNPKGETEREIPATWKIIILSNPRPSIDNEKADIRRILPVRVRELEIEPPLEWYGLIGKHAGDFLCYCFSRYQQALALDPRVRVQIPADQVAIEEAVGRTLENIDDAIDSLFNIVLVHDEILGDIPTLRCGEVHAAISAALKTSINDPRLKDRVEAALLRRGVVRKAKPHRHYRGLSFKVNPNVLSFAGGSSVRKAVNA